jgi:hypothetical protein
VEGRLRNEKTVVERVQTSRLVRIFLSKIVASFGIYGSGATLTGRKVKPREIPTRDVQARKLSPTERVDLAADMTSAAMEIMLDNIRARNPGISKRKLLEKARKRMFASEQ